MPDIKNSQQDHLDDYDYVDFTPRCFIHKTKKKKRIVNFF